MRKSTRLAKQEMTQSKKVLSRRALDTDVKPTIKRVKPSVDQPLHWEEVYGKIKEYRKTHEAAVDTMGCERLAQTDIPERQARFQTLFSLMLSSQTKDTVTSATVRAMQRDMPGGLCLESILTIDEKRLDKYIAAVGFHNKKAIYIKKTAEILRDKYGGDIPDTIEGLTSLPGVGPKMGYLALQIAWKKNHGIGVDVHVHRIANRLGWCNTSKGLPEDTRKALESWIPTDRWREINPLLVGFGQILCLPRGPKCGECPVKDLCPSASVPRGRKSVVKQESDVTTETKTNASGGDGYPVVKQEDTLSW